MKRPFQDLAHPSAYSLQNAANVRIAVEGDDIGAWFLNPFTTAATAAATTTDENRLLNLDVRKVLSGEKVVLYLHGNAATRSQHHRVELYKIYQREGYHVLAVDYRGYADSRGSVKPDEETMTRDALAAYDWLETNALEAGAEIVIHGHSLGTGVATRLGAVLAAREDMRRLRLRPAAMILEAPFNRMLDEVMTFEKSVALAVMLGFNDVPGLLKEAKCEFDSEKWISEIGRSWPILILHAEDDQMIPIRLGRRLYERAESKCDVQLITFDGEHGFRHEHMWKNPDLGRILNRFILNSK